MKFLRTRNSGGNIEEMNTREANCPILCMTTQYMALSSSPRSMTNKTKDLRTEL